MKLLNAFDKLVLHGCREKWCWRLYCTTCGNMQFRNGMELIGKGQDPLIEHDASAQSGLLWHDDFSLLADRSLPLGCQIIAANIAEYHRQHRGIDWLGFMGLALWRFEQLVSAAPATNYQERMHIHNRELILQLISNSWSKQFYSLLAKHAEQRRGSRYRGGIQEAMQTCKEIMLGERPRFQIGDLEIMESGICEINEQGRD
jgi:hypothetical protein